jgi:hypothetical protein
MFPCGDCGQQQSALKGVKSPERNAVREEFTKEGKKERKKERHAPPRVKYMTFRNASHPINQAGPGSGV